MPLIKANTDIETQAALIFDKEKTAWETSTVFVTERVSFNIRNLIRLCRKNYWGVFDDPVDPTTGHKKIWPPLSESLVEASVKSIDVDTKDLNVRAKRAESVGIAHIVRAVLRNGLDAIDFGEILDDLERRLGIDGTVVAKIIEEDYNGKKRACIKAVDLLNWYIDPTAASIHDSPTIERMVMTSDEVNDADLPLNKELLIPKENIQRYDGELNSAVAYNATGGKVQYFEIYERFGKISKYLITGKEEDRSKEVNGHMIASYNSGWIIHLIETWNKRKPYEEGWWTRVPGRWYGRGVVEKAIMLQLWLNMVVNMRINRSRVAQLGIFKYKKGSGITPQMLGRLASNGAIPVTNMDDIENFVIQEAGVSSYKDEEDIMGWAQRVTSAFEVVTGESLPSSTSATAIAVQSRATNSSFSFIRKGFGKFLERVIENHFLPIEFKNLTRGDIVRITGDPEDLRVLDERAANEMVYQALKDIKEKNESSDEKTFVDPMQVEQERQRIMAQLRNMGSERYQKVVKDIDYTEYDVKVFVTDEEFDKAVMAQNLTATLQFAPEFKDQIVQSIFDLMGLEFKAQQVPQVQQPQQPQLSGGQPVQNLQQAVTRATTQQAIG